MADYLPDIDERFREQCPPVAETLARPGMATGQAGPLDERPQRLVKLGIATARSPKAPCAPIPAERSSSASARTNCGTSPCWPSPPAASPPPSPASAGSRRSCARAHRVAPCRTGRGRHPPRSRGLHPWSGRAPPRSGRCATTRVAIIPLALGSAQAHGDAGSGAGACWSSGVGERCHGNNHPVVGRGASATPRACRRRRVYRRGGLGSFPLSPRVGWTHLRTYGVPGGSGVMITRQTKTQPRADYALEHEDDDIEIDVERSTPTRSPTTDGVPPGWCIPTARGPRPAPTASRPRSSTRAARVGSGRSWTSSATTGHRMATCSSTAPRSSSPPTAPSISGADAGRPRSPDPQGLTDSGVPNRWRSDDSAGIRPGWPWCGTRAVRCTA